MATKKSTKKPAKKKVTTSKSGKSRVGVAKKSVKPVKKVIAKKKPSKSNKKSIKSKKSKTGLKQTLLNLVNP